MTGTRHLTASAIVFDPMGRVLLVHHGKAHLWLYPGGHVEPNEDPAQAAVREVREETGVSVDIVTKRRFLASPLPSLHVPYAILEVPASGPGTGPHRHIDMVFVCSARSYELTAQREEVHDCLWASPSDLPQLDIPPELPSLIAEAALYWSEMTSGQVVDPW